MPNVVPDIPPAPAAYDGQFIQMDIVSVVAREQALEHLRWHAV